MFTDGDASSGKLAWVSGWRKLPHISQQVQKLYEYPQQFAEEIFERIEQAWRGRAAGEASTVVQTGRLFIVSGDVPAAGSKAALIADLPVDYVLSSDVQVVAAHKAQSCDQARLLLDRNEGEFVVSYQTPGGWAAITKDILTAVLGAGRDVKIVGLPAVAAGALGLMCPDLAFLP